MDDSRLLFLVWILLAFGGMGLVLTIAEYAAARIMKPKDQVPTSNPRVTRRLADIIEQEEQIKALGIERAELGNKQAGKRADP